MHNQLQDNGFKYPKNDFFPMSQLSVWKRTILYGI